MNSLPEIITNPEIPETRNSTYLKAAASAGVNWFNAEGKWVAPMFPLGTRSRFWLSLALYGSGLATFADTVIRSSNTDKSEEMRRHSSFDIFHSNIAVALLTLHRHSMALDVRLMLEELVNESFSILAGNRQPDYQFHGYNDNMPAKATMGLILGGELLGNNDAVEHGLWNLRHFAAQLSRRGINSEFNSPTYTPLTIHAISEIARHANNEEAAQMAADIESRLWIDLASRFHPATGLVAGPYSRAYTVDLLGHYSNLSTLLWLVLGDRIQPSPMDLFMPKHDGSHLKDLVLHHRGNLAFNTAQFCWYASGSYKIPEDAMAQFHDETIAPKHSIATAELGHCGEYFPARPVRIETSIQDVYSVGTSSTPFLNGVQAAPYFITYAKRTPVSSIQDRGTIYWKFLADDAKPGIIAKEHPEYENQGEDDDVQSLGNAITLQSNSTTLLLSHPSFNLSTYQQPLEHTRLSEAVVFPSHFGGADEVIINNQHTSSWSGTAKNGTWIGCRRGNFLTAIRPLAYTRDWGPPIITLEKSGAYELLKTTFYDDKKRHFTVDELRWIFGGFVAEHGSLQEHGSLINFMHEVSHGSFTDYSWMTRRVLYERPSGNALPPLTMEISWSPGSHCPRHALINNQLVDSPRTAYSWIQDKDLPLSLNHSIPAPKELPWDQIICAQADWPSLIGEK